MESALDGAATSSAASTAAGWTSQFDLDRKGFLGKGRGAIELFARELHAHLPEAPPEEIAQGHLLRAARETTHPSAEQYALTALADKLPRVLLALKGWSSADVLKVFDELSRRWHVMLAEGRFNLDLDDVVAWVASHDGHDRAAGVAACIAVDAPVEVRITRRLAQAGSQKVVFEAQWTVADDPTEIVVKQFLDGMDDILDRELRPHPLSMRHPNIIETYWLANQARVPEVFLVERRIDPLRNDIRLSGFSEMARLLIDMARALAFLDDQGLVHGDIKPDNIAVNEDRFILLDFGICRPASDFEQPEATATGSLRTRAPELMYDDGRHTSKSDVWAVGATIFNLWFGRFPLWRDDDPDLPRLQDSHGERTAAEARMKSRIELDYEANIADLSRIEHDGLRQLLRGALQRDPERRLSASQILSGGLQALSSLVGLQDGPLFDPGVEVHELEKHLSSDARDLALLSARERRAMTSHLTDLERSLRARRHYLRPARRLASAARIATLQTSLDDEDLELARALSDVDKYVARSDGVDDRRLERLRERLSSADDDACVGAPPANNEDLPTLLRRLAASSLNANERMRSAADSLAQLLPPDE